MYKYAGAFVCECICARVSVPAIQLTMPTPSWAYFTEGVIQGHQQPKLA